MSFSLVASACFASHDAAAAARVLEAARASGLRSGGPHTSSNVRRARPGRGVGLALAVLHEDDALLAVEKPAGVLVHPTGGGGGGGSDRRTLCDAALLRCGREGLSRLNGAEARGVVHRLDRGTSGCMVLAKTDAAHAVRSCAGALRLQLR